MITLRRILMGLMLAAAFAGLPLSATAETGTIGIVIMHGKGGTPTRHVAGLAGELEGKGYFVANLEMPWSGRREYDSNVDAAEREVESALAKLRTQGARKVFVAGHSQGGTFALHFAGQHSVDGIIAMAPGGNVGNKVNREKLGESVARARRLVAEGKGDEKTRLDDFEGSKGVFSITTTPAVYLTWFDPDGAMNMQRAARGANPRIPILWIVAKRDYPGLRNTNIPMFATLPANPLTKLYEPDADHLGAPEASIGEIARWTAEVASK